ncbi:unnamed protein product [Brachionus calyciflorus]|uniref:Uncharacterized protein n=1 Tax=Brachionus calyciflorus TaxID=104777 RepID=A0A814LYF4_9BILA|nr:unnamed protein product [Brachionus calyciflorus]
MSFVVPTNQLTRYNMDRVQINSKHNDYRQEEMDSNNVFIMPDEPISRSKENQLLLTPSIQKFNLTSTPISKINQTKPQASSFQIESNHFVRETQFIPKTPVIPKLNLTLTPIIRPNSTVLNPPKFSLRVTKHSLEVSTDNIEKNSSHSVSETLDEEPMSRNIIAPEINSFLVQDSNNERGNDVYERPIQNNRFRMGFDLGSFSFISNPQVEKQSAPTIEENNDGLEFGFKGSYINMNKKTVDSLDLFKE